MLFAGDHGIAAQGVSAYPSDVTVQMLHNFAAGGAAIAVLARELGVPLTVVDAGTLAHVDRRCDDRQAAPRHARLLASSRR